MNAFELQVRQSIRDRVATEGSAKCIYCDDPGFSVKMFCNVHDPISDFYVRCQHCKVWYPGIVLTPIIAH